jgi:hypothetical protein
MRAKIRTVASSLVPLGWLVLLASPSAAFATLGGDVTTVTTDQTQMQATRHVASVGPYTVHDITLPSGTAVREYVGPSGTVFGVAWQGPFMPDLAQLFGGYFNEFVAGANAVHAAHGAHRGPLSVSQADLVVQSTGRMRAFIGRAYLPQQVPAGVSIDDIK